jgi:virginiamycin B lyase
MGGTRIWLGVIVTSLAALAAQPASAAVTEFGLATANSQPAGIATGPDGNLWAASSGSDRIVRISPAGARTEFTLPAGRAPRDVASVGALIWFTEVNGDRVGRLDPAAGDIQASIVEFVVPGAGSKPTSISAGPDGNAWFTEAGSDEIGRITTGGVITEFVVPGAGSAPSGITAGADGALWFTESGSNQIGRITTTGVVTNEFPVASLESTPSKLGDITAGPDGAVWFVDSGVDHVGRMAIDGAASRFAAPAGSGLEGIASGPDGALWVTEGRAGKIARLATDGTRSEYSLPNLGANPAGPAGITAGPDGALWFTERLASAIGRITTDTTPDALPVGATGPQGAPGTNGAPGPAGPAGETRIVVVAFQVRPAKARAGRRLSVRFAITGRARVQLQVKRGRAAARTVSRKTITRAGVGTLTWNGKLGKRRAKRGTYTLIVRATAGGKSATSRLRVRLR